MSKTLCIVTSSILIAATAAQAAGLYSNYVPLSAAGLVLTAAGTLLYLFSGRKAGTSPTKTATASNEQPASYVASGASPDTERETGTVKWFNTTKGFGFISRDNGDDIFVHFRAIRGEGHRVLAEGQRVEYSIISRDKGLQAEDVVEISD